MQTIKRLCCLFIGFLALAYQTAFADESYLYKPTGRYNVGYKDLHWINEGVCPDPFYTGKNKDDFSPENQTRFCREMMVRIYYPTYDGPVMGNLYYQPQVQDIQSQLTYLQSQIHGLTDEMIQQFGNLTSYTRKDASLVPNTSFPVIIFSPGLQADAQDYEDHIVDIASHGYIVIGINHSFISNAVELPDGHVIDDVVSTMTNKQNDKAVFSDIAYAYHQMFALHNSGPIFSAMDLKHIGIFGHSNGAYHIVEMVHQLDYLHLHWFNAAAALAVPGSLLPYQYKQMEKGFDIPFLHIHDAEWQTRYWWNDGVFTLKKNGYFVWLTPTLSNVTYSGHNNFDDTSTLQSLRALQLFDAYDKSQGPGHVGLDVGDMDGTLAVQITNEYLLAFFDKYLKNIPSPIFDTCTKIPNTLLQCGPGKTPPHN